MYQLPTVSYLAPEPQSLQALRLRLPNPEFKAFILIETKHQVHVTDGLPRRAPDQIVDGGDSDDSTGTRL